MLELEIPYFTGAVPHSPDSVESLAGASQISPAAWIVALFCAVLAVAAGLGLGYVLSGRPDSSLIRSKLTGTTQAALHLRIDYQLTHAGRCAGRAAHCRSVRVSFRDGVTR